ncbi:MAG: phosphoribosylformylglycinamidine synthase [Peptostreptococcaceae bacterium]|nr:phosphoribosylformylglycinamidine synthase [Peptostreptococcaceae bacterium]
MKILIIGGGAREHAIAYKLSRSGKVEKIYAAPGNAGIAELAELVPIKATEIEKLADFAEKHRVDLTVVGPEDPLCMGIVDFFAERGLRAYGPGKNAAQLEGSKSFAKEFMMRNDIPTAAYYKTEDPEEAKEIYQRLFAASPHAKAVIKADGLCAGKGVLVGESPEEGCAFIDRIAKGEFSKDAFSVVIEEYLEGIEASLLCFVDGKSLIPMPTAKDHKRIREGEKGPNTGGMGTYSPNPIAEVYLQEMLDKVAYPFHRALEKEGLSYRGIIFFGFMITEQGVKVLEFNVRFGDPETQSILMRLQSDLAEIFSLSMEDRLSEAKILWSEKQSLTLVLASKGYPLQYEKEKPIRGLAQAAEGEDRAIFHAGTAEKDGVVLTSGGRVLSLTALGKDVDEAMSKAYEMAEKIDFEGKTFRSDIGSLVKRVYVAKRGAYDLEALALKRELAASLGVEIRGIRLYQRYDLQGLTAEEIEKIKDTILREPMVDDIFIQEEAFAQEKNFLHPIVIQLHQGQYDQREDGLIQSICVVLGKEDVKIRTSRVFDIDGELSEEELKKIKAYLINPIDQQEGSMKLPNLLESESDIRHEAQEIRGLIEMNEEELFSFFKESAPAMNFEDMKYLQRYFKEEEKRDPTDVEFSMIDTYWSDHCRHTTFNTILSKVEFVPSDNQTMNRLFQEAYEDYLLLRRETGREEKPVTLMEMATIMARAMRKDGRLEDLEVSDEINACSVKIRVDIEKDGTIEQEDYLLMFKNETHNHPTEIEPFGGASTCLGGAIRDPLSGRAYVYQAMRLTGSADPRESIADTLAGKLPQRKITTEAAAGYSSYGNQIGLCTGYVDEVYHEGFKAKRMEVGAVIGAAPAENVLRLRPEAGDRIILIGGRTGRDGVGGATGSSKEHTEQSITLSSAEVQKGNAPSERKLLRLFRNKEVTNLIKKCNDFGAGGVSVAIGELAEGLHILLDKVPLKYLGLTPREIAISESQERMACVVAEKDVSKFMNYCHEENIEATEVAQVTKAKRLVMTYYGKKVVDLDREFLDSAGVTALQEVRIPVPQKVSRLAEEISGRSLEEELKKRLSDLNVCSKKGLIEKFDNTIGASSALLPLGGKLQLTPAQGMAAYIPSLKGLSHTLSLMSCGYEPYLGVESPFHGAYYAVIESVSKLIAMGGEPDKIRLSFQEYFEKLGSDSEKWGKPAAALLGALKAQRQLDIPAIGGKDSMSGSFRDLHVPPTLISFAVTHAKGEDLISPELKGAGHTLAFLHTPYLADGSLDIGIYRKNLALLLDLAQSGALLSAYAVTAEGVLAAICKTAIGNKIGVDLKSNDRHLLLSPAYGSFILELEKEDSRLHILGQTMEKESLRVQGEFELSLDEIIEIYERPLEEIFPVKNKGYESRWKLTPLSENTSSRAGKAKLSIARPRVLISVFPGTNCEYDTAAAFERAGAKTRIKVFRNQSLGDIEESMKEFEKEIRSSQIFMIPGGFSLGDEPDGSGKFIAAVLRNPRIADALSELLHENDGLILGICNGFQALIKTGLLPYGELRALDEKAPTLTHNEVGRHVAQFVKTKVMTDRSPWTSKLHVGDIHDIPVSHGEGRLIAEEEVIASLYAKDQVAFQYVTPLGEKAEARPYNPNGSMGSIEGLISPCGRILGKMGHSERIREGVYKNYPVSGRQLLFEGGTGYYK